MKCENRKACESISKRPQNQPKSLHWAACETCPVKSVRHDVATERSQRPSFLRKVFTK